MFWSADFAYVVGLITSDGNLSSDGRHINLTSKDYEQVLHFKTILGLSNKIGLKGRGGDKTKKYFVVQFGNVKLYRFLLSIGLCPNKSKVLKELKVPDEYFPDFLRGAIDGDGFSYSYWDKRWKSSFCFYTGVVSASPLYLKWVQETVKRLYNIQGSIKYVGKSVHELIYAKKESLALVPKMYYDDKVTCLSRKYSKIMASLDIITKQRRDVEMEAEHA